jgi:hypothetical protein
MAGTQKQWNADPHVRRGSSTRPPLSLRKLIARGKAGAIPVWPTVAPTVELVAVDTSSPLPKQAEAIKMIRLGAKSQAEIAELFNVDWSTISR